MSARTSTLQELGFPSSSSAGCLDVHRGWRRLLCLRAACFPGWHPIRPDIRSFLAPECHSVLWPPTQPSKTMERHSGRNLLRSCAGRIERRHAICANDSRICDKLRPGDHERRGGKQVRRGAPLVRYSAQSGGLYSRCGRDQSCHRCLRRRICPICWGRTS